MAEIVDEDFNQIIAEIEGGQTKSVEKVEPKKTVEKTEKLYPHEEILAEEGLTKDDMPKDIRDMIVTFNLKLKMAKKAGEEATMLKIQNLSTLIADKIISYIESSDKSYENIDLNEEGNKIDEEEELEEEEELKGLFGGVLGGIFDY
tara:strand:+ start:381 stop:821 length:441 start_codon:yes stop_codon:yes gene_type:complete